MSEIKYFTAEGLQKLKDELDDLILRERPRIIQAIAEAFDMTVDIIDIKLRDLAPLKSL